MPYIQVDTEVWIEPEDFLRDLKDEDLIEELKCRNYNVDVLVKVQNTPLLSGTDHTMTLTRLYELKAAKDPKFDAAFSEYIWNTLGKVV